MEKPEISARIDIEQSRDECVQRAEIDVMRSFTKYVLLRLQKFVQWIW